MLVFVLGEPESGKSELAENLALELSGGGARIYLATMLPLDTAARERIVKHRANRSGKGFVTVEEAVHIGNALRSMPGIAEAVCLLECVSNLVGNAMHLKAEELQRDTVSAWALEEIRKLNTLVKHLVVVSNRFPEEGADYDSETREYVRLLHEVNRGLREAADIRYEYREGAWDIS